MSPLIFNHLSFSHLLIKILLLLLLNVSFYFSSKLLYRIVNSSHLPLLLTTVLFSHPNSNSAELVHINSNDFLVAQSSGNFLHCEHYISHSLLKKHLLKWLLGIFFPHSLFLICLLLWTPVYLLICSLIFSPCPPSGWWFSFSSHTHTHTYTHTHAHKRCPASQNSSIRQQQWFSYPAASCIHPFGFHMNNTNSTCAKLNFPTDISPLNVH